MRRFLPIAAIMAASLCLSGCALLGPLAGMAAGAAGVPASPSVVADRTTLDEQAALAVETAYQAGALAGTLAFRSGLVAPSSNADVQRPDFCQMVVAHLVNEAGLDRGGRIAAIDCRAYAAVQAARRAYDAGNATSYGVAVAEARALVREMTGLIRGEGN